jgi:ketosteroid isomerase-like protein
MTLKILGFSLVSFMLGAALFANFSTRVSTAQPPEDRAADRKAIQAHIESIFQAFINKDAKALRATHAENWLGYLDNSGTLLKGIEGYMDWNQVDPKSPYGMKSYKFREFDMIFKGDAAFVCFVSDVESNWPGRSPHRALQICDFYTKDKGSWIQSGSYTGLHQETLQEQLSSPGSIGDDMKKRLLDAREAVWRAWFTGDRATLEKLIPQETIATGAGENTWSNRQKILDDSVEFARGGGKLVKLEFPKTEIQVYGATAIVYSNYSYDLEQGGKRINQSGRVTEVFVQRKGEWVNPGWHMDSGK